MTIKTLVIAVPILVVKIREDQGEIPYGPAVVNGILSSNGYESTVWDLNIDLHNQFKNDWPTIVDMFGTRGYRKDVENISITRVLSWIQKQVINKLDEIKPDVILLSIFSSQSLDFVIPLSTMIKECRPDVYVIAGGRGVDNIERRSRTRYADLYAKYLPLDCVYCGDAENDLVSVIQKRVIGVYNAPPVSAEVLENTPRPSWKGYDFHNYIGYENKSIRLPITGSKGCVRECTFCDVAASWPKFVYRKGVDIAREIIDTYKESGIYKFEFTDNLINGSISNFKAMNTVLANEFPNTFDYKGYAICRPKQSMPAEDFTLASKAGAKFFKVGIESGSEKVRNDIKKKFSNEDITWFAENCVKNNIKQSWLMFVGYPTETEEDFQDTLKLLKDHSYLAKDGAIEIFLSLPMMLTSGSGFMQRHAEEYGLEHNQHDPWSDFFWTSTKFNSNTFDIRTNRWHRLMEAIYEYGYSSDNSRQSEKFKDIEGIEKIYSDYLKNAKKVIPITASSFNVNKETHI